MDLPKPQFAYVGRLYLATKECGFNPGNLNREDADSVMRMMSKTPWLDQNYDLHRIWMLGGDTWGDTIKLVKAYNSVVNQHKRDLAKKIKAEKKS